CLALAAAFLCSYFVWALPEFWQALVAIGSIGLFVSVAAWGSFCSGGAYAPQPRLAKAALAMTLLAGLLIASVLGKQLLGESFDAGMHYQADLHRQGRVLLSFTKEGVGEIAITDLDGHAENALLEQSWWRAEFVLLEFPSRWGYRHNSRFYVGCGNNSKPGNE